MTAHTEGVSIELVPCTEATDRRAWLMYNAIVESLLDLHAASDHEEEGPKCSALSHCG